METGSSREIARQAHTTNPVTHRELVGRAKGRCKRAGQSATHANVIGWPANYLIDGDGIIQFVDLREEDLLIAVRRLVEAQAE